MMSLVRFLEIQGRSARAWPCNYQDYVLEYQDFSRTAVSSRHVTSKILRKYNPFQQQQPKRRYHCGELGQLVLTENLCCYCVCTRWYIITRDLLLFSQPLHFSSPRPQLRRASMGRCAPRFASALTTSPAISENVSKHREQSRIFLPNLFDKLRHSPSNDF